MSTQFASVILAAGQGTRMKSALPKVLHELGGEPMVSAPVRLSLELGCDPVVLVVGHQAERVKDRLLTSFPGHLRFALQEEQRGTGHAVMAGMKALKGFSGRVFIFYGDVPLLTKSTCAKLSKRLDREEADLAFITMNLEDPTGYGRVVRDSQGRVLNIVEEKDADADQKAIREVNAGIYCVDAKLLNRALSRLRNDNAQGEYYLTDIVEIASDAGRRVATLEVQDPNEVRGVNDRRQLAELDGLNRRRIIEHWMDQGVTFIDPAQTYVGGRVKIGRDTVVHPGVHLRGTTTIGKDCKIDVGCVITDSVVKDGVSLHPYSVLEEADVRSRSNVGPFARLRPGAQLMEESRVGNFVELKKTKLGKGAKANHLAYLGDASVGPHANVGAGTITCNYDGYGKYQTDIGEGVFVGSNATLVAPVKIGKDAYVAAGSTITDAIGKDDLAFGRARQVNKKGRGAEVRRTAAEQAKQAKKNAKRK